MDEVWILAAACIVIALPSAWLVWRWYWRRWVDAMLDEVLPDPYARPFGDVPTVPEQARKAKRGAREAA